MNEGEEAYSAPGLVGTYTCRAPPLPHGRSPQPLYCVIHQMNPTPSSPAPAPVWSVIPAQLPDLVMLEYVLLLKTAMLEASCEAEYWRLEH